MQSEERERFDAFVRARGPELLRFAYALTGARPGAEDLFQEALVRVGARWATVVTGGDPAAYVRQVMVHTRVSWWRRLRRERLVATPPAKDYTPPVRDEVVWAALRTLPPRQRAVLALRYLADYSEVATAQVLGCSTGTVKSQAAKALSKLRASMPAPGVHLQEGCR